MHTLGTATLDHETCRRERRPSHPGAGRGLCTAHRHTPADRSAAGCRPAAGLCQWLGPTARAAVYLDGGGPGPAGDWGAGPWLNGPVDAAPAALAWWVAGGAG